MFHALLEGLEGHPAGELTRAFHESKKKLYVVNDPADEAGSEAKRGALRCCVEAANAPQP